MKHGAIVRITAVVALAVAAGAAVLYLDHLPPSRLASLLGISVTVSDLQHSPTPLPSVSVLPVSDQVPALSLSTVAVQTFSGPTLVRAATGTVVTSDGLIITTTAGAPYGSGSFVYQVATAKGALLRARRVAFDGAAGLVLLKAEGADMDAATLGSVPAARAGEQLTILGATVALSQYVPVVLQASVVYAIRQSDPVLSWDRTLLPILTGARIVDRTGLTIGLLRPGGTGIIPASAMDEFLRRQLNSPTP